MILSLGLGALTLVVGYLAAEPALATIAADAETTAMGKAYLFGFLPALALSFPTNAMGSALRAAGVARPTMLLQSGTVVLNAVLAPVLIAGWGTGMPLGVFGAGLASSIAAGRRLPRHAVRVRPVPDLDRPSAETAETATGASVAASSASACRRRASSC